MFESRALLPRRELLALVAELRRIEEAAAAEPDTERFERIDAVETCEREPTSAPVPGG